MTAPAVCGSGWRKPADTLTDRAARYRANSPECRPPEPRICVFCGSARNVEVHHLDGEELSTEPQNLVWACRRCNVAVGIVLKQAGLGRRARQFNPRDPQGAHTVAQWVTAVLSMKGESSAMDVPAAVEIIRATPADRRSHFAQQIWRIRRKHGH